MQKIVINADNVGDLLTGYGAGARIELERSATGGGAGFAQIATVPLVAGQEQYEYWDPSGTTGSFYRVRYTTSVGASPSEWSAEFLGAGSIAYASLDDLRELLSMPDNSRDNLLSDLLLRATAWIDDKCHRSFRRDPLGSGSTVRTFSPSRKTRLVQDIIALDTLEVSLLTGGTFLPLSATDWVFEPWTTDTYIGADGALHRKPYEEITLSDVGAYSSWSVAAYSRWNTEFGGYGQWNAGYGTVRLTGAFGWPVVPMLISQAVLDLAREWYRQGPGGGGPIGVNQFGTPLFLQGMPNSAKDAVATYRRSWGAA